VLGVGNVLKGDDGVGAYVVACLLEAISGKESSRRIYALDCGTVPENYTSVVRRLGPGRVVIVDAADMALDAGSVRIVPKGRVGALGLSTHSMPLSLFMDYIEGLVPEVVLVGIQPQSMRLAGQMSEQVRAAGEQLAALIYEDRLCEVPQLSAGLLRDN